jgi:hypothetical protein
MEELPFDDLLENYRWHFDVENPSILDWTSAMRVHPKITDPPARDERPYAPARNTVIFGPAGDRLAHADGELHLVVVDDPARLEEARRVARDGVVTLRADGTATAEWMRPPVPRSPTVTVLVHTGDTPAALEACLRAIAEATPRADAIELLVVDDGQTDAFAVATAWGAHYVRADPAQGRVAALNVGAEAARGRLIVFLADHIELRRGWLRPLTRLLRADPDVGVVGAKALTPEGRLAHAGGVLFADGSTEGFGRGSLDPDDPLVGFVRDVSYVSFDLLATRAGLLQRLGGLDTLLTADRADVDYCLRVRAAQRRVVFQPESHFVSRRVDALPAHDHRLFLRRWGAPLAARAPRPERLDAGAWARLARVT